MAVIGLSRAFVSQGHRVFIYGYGQGKAEIGPDIVVRGFPRPAGPGGIFALLGGGGDLLSHVTEDHDALDVLLIHGAFGSSTRMLAQACRAQGIATIAYPHIPYSPALFADRRMLKRSFFALIERPYLRRVDAIHVHAPSHATYLPGLKVFTPSFVIPCGIRPELLDEHQSNRDDHDYAVPAYSGRFRILYFGRLDIWMKGLDLLLEAIALDHSLQETVEVTLLGKGERGAREELRALAERRGIAEIVTLIDHSEDPWRIVREADLVVLPSRFDGFAQTVCEALSFGIPVLVSTKAAPSEHLSEDHGVLVTEPRPDAILRALHEAIRSHQELRAAAQGAKPHLRANFDWEVIAGQWLLQFKSMGIPRDRREQGRGSE